MVRRALAVCAAALVLCCSGARPKTCTPEARAALVSLYERAAIEVVTSGACDSVADVTACPAYLAVDAHMAIAQKALCE
jgi:hypothetical protein